MHHFMELTEPGLPGWSKTSRFCLRCGRYDIPHRALGMCRRCHQIDWHYRTAFGVHAPPPTDERWATHWPRCRSCLSITREHQGHGFCRTCYSRAKKESLRNGKSTTEILAAMDTGKVKRYAPIKEAPTGKDRK
jgi:hypothetical protein